jgi:epoxyqueuosine reductase QueG
VRANAKHRNEVSDSWRVAYTETNCLIETISEVLAGRLGEMGVRASAEPPTGRFDRTALSSTWSHKSVAVIAGLGSLGVHRMLITEAGCAGRVGSLVLDKELPPTVGDGTEGCIHLARGGCLECVERCPVGALQADGSLNKRLCWARCRSVAARFADLGGPEVCGKCALGPCALRSAA